MRKNLTKNLKLLLSASMCGLVLSGCSINPTPSQSFGLPTNVDVTNDIIDRTRCEARDTMILAAAQLLENIDSQDLVFISQKNGDTAEDIVMNLRKNPSNLNSYKEWELPPILYIIASPILRSSLGLDFTFTITEANNDSFSPELTSNTGSNVFTLGIASHQLNRSRQNLRSINVRPRNFDTFQNIKCADDITNDSKNDGKRIKTFSKVNPVYPLKGNIQLYKTIGTFINFIFLDANKEEEGIRRNFARNALTNATSVLYSDKTTQITISDKSPKAKQEYIKTVKKLKQISNDLNSNGCNDLVCQNAKACYSYLLSEASDIYMKDLYSTYSIPADKGITMSDTLRFRTEISGGLTPKIVYGTPSSLDLQAAAFSFNPSRIDVHQVKVSMTAAIPPKEKTQPKFIPVLTGVNGNQFFERASMKVVKEGPIAECSKYEVKSLSASRKRTEKKIAINSQNAFPIVQDTEEVKLLKQQSETTNTENVAIERLIQSGGALPIQ